MIAPVHFMFEEFWLWRIFA